MAQVSAEAGYGFGIGGTNSRTAIYNAGELSGFESVSTPQTAEAFFKFLVNGILSAAHSQEAHWAVVGVPGPVQEFGDSYLIGPFRNVPSLSEARYDVVDELIEADTDFQRALDEGFKLTVVNDGTLAAQAVAEHVSGFEANTVGALIVGTGVGSGVVERRTDYSDVYGAIRLPLEIGHIPLSSDDPTDTFENNYSGPALKRKFGKEPSRLAPDSPAWEYLGHGIGRMALELSLMAGTELVVPTGGVGVGSGRRYRRHLRDYLAALQEKGNATQRQFIPEIKLVPENESQIFEMYGLGGVARDAFLNLTDS